MSWQVHNALKRVFNSFKRNKKGIYNEDLEALKLINEAIENATKNYVNDNLLYAKLLCVHLRQNVLHFGDIQQAIKQIKSELEIPLQAHIQYLEKQMNDTDLKNYLKSIGITIDFETKEDLDQNKKSISENQKAIIEKLKTNWSFSNVEKSFYNSANTFLKDPNNYT